MIIQVCFSLKGELTLEMVEQKLLQLKNELEGSDYTIHSCFLPAHFYKEKGFGTEVPDMFVKSRKTHWKKH